MDLLAELRGGHLSVSVYGLGYVGLALSAAWYLAGARVVGVDVDPVKVQELNAGVVRYPEEAVSEALSRALAEGRFTATTDGVEASIKTVVKLVAVPVYLKRNGPYVDVDFSALTSAAKAIGAGLKRGDLVVVESSVPPGTTEEVVRPALEAASGLTAEEDFYLAYSPERMMVGRALRDLEYYPKVVAGIGSRSAEVAASLYAAVAKGGVVKLSSVRAAEFEKLLEGVYRDVNIALANEMARLANAMGIPFAEVREAANTRHYRDIHRPGTGVGGGCIPIYPHFLIWTAARYGLRLKLAETARQVNEEQPREVALAVVRALIKHGVNPATAKVAVLGLAFRGDVDDVRESPTYAVVETLLKLGISPAQLAVHDPMVRVDRRLEAMGVRLTDRLEEALRDADVALVATDHSAYRVPASRLAAHMRRPLILDARGVVKPDLEIYSLEGGRWP